METLFFVGSKLFWVLARPESWIVILLLLAMVALRRDRDRLGRRILMSTLAFILVVGTLPLGELLLRPLETRFPANPNIDDPAGIIILGGGEDARAMAETGLAGVNEAGERFLAAIALARTHTDARLIFTGGSGRLFGDGLRGSDVAERIFEDAGIDAARIVLEGDSRNTAENATKTLELLELIDHTNDGPWVLVTSAFHMPRAVGAFCAAGWSNLVPYPVDYRGVGRLRIGWDLADRLDTLNTAVREWIGLLAYRATSRASQLFPQAC